MAEIKNSVALEMLLEKAKLNKKENTMLTAECFLITLIDAVFAGENSDEINGAKNMLSKK